jgi:hypothetical protein
LSNFHRLIEKSTKVSLADGSGQISCSVLATRARRQRSAATTTAQPPQQRSAATRA